MTKNQFTRLIQRCDSKHFTAIALEKDGKITPLKSIKIDRKNRRLYLNITEEKGNPYINVCEISNFDRLSQHRRLSVELHYSNKVR